MYNKMKVPSLSKRSRLHFAKLSHKLENLKFYNTFHHFVQCQLCLYFYPYQWDQNKTLIPACRWKTIITYLHVIFLAIYTFFRLLFVALDSCTVITAPARTDPIGFYYVSDNHIRTIDLFMCFVQSVTVLNMSYITLINPDGYSMEINHWLLMGYSKLWEYCTDFVYQRPKCRMFFNQFFIFLYIGLPLKKAYNKFLHFFLFCVVAMVFLVTTFYAVHHTFISKEASCADLFYNLGGKNETGHTLYLLLDYYILFETLLVGAHASTVLLWYPFGLLYWLSVAGEYVKFYFKVNACRNNN